MTEKLRTNAAKAAVLLLTSLLAPALLVLSAALIMSWDGGWTLTEEDLPECGPVLEALWRQREMADSYCRFEYAWNGAEGLAGIARLSPQRTNYRFALYDGEGHLLYSTVSEGDRPYPDLTETVSSEKPEYFPELPEEEIAPEHWEGLQNGRLESFLDPALPVRDGIYRAWTLAAFLLAVSRFALPLFVLCAAAALGGLALLALSAGRRPGEAGVFPGWQEKIPLDLYAGLSGAAALLLAAALAELSGRWLDLSLSVWGTACFLAAWLLALVVLGAWETLWVRWKAGRWWENTVCFRLLSPLLRLGRRALRGAAKILGDLPLLWRTAAALVILTVLEFLGLAVTQHETDIRMLLWLLEKAVLLPAALYIAWCLRKLQKGGEELAAGNLAYETDTRYLPGDFRRHGECLNSISQGMAAAVEQRLRSERLRTELITNVSHDLKTPLTSILNYADLLSRDPRGEHAEEYLAVLTRHAQKLKKLTEDLVEVSKAATGNLPVHPERTNLSELVLQALGEYSDRLDRAGLEAVATVPEGECLVLADGTLLWRVLDNLFSNVCKYAQSGTRFYVDAHPAGDGAVVLTLRNISRERLNVPVEELLERFVRGDASRAGEGSGLGLNIAQSLTEIQNGRFRLTVDGDLFKVEITLPACP